MLNELKRFWKEEDGLGTVEIVIIVAVLVGVALLFRKAIWAFVSKMIEKAFPDASNLKENNIVPVVEPSIKNGG